MNKKRKLFHLISLLTMMVFVVLSLMLPFVQKTQNHVQAENEKTPLYAFATITETDLINGAVYVDFGLSMDMFPSAEKITRADVLAMMMAYESIDKYPFQSAKLYLRTRNVSAIAEAGDYQAMDEVVTINGIKPYTTVRLQVNSNGLQVDNNARQFCVEIFKVEVTGLSENLQLVQPNTTPDISTEMISTGYELNLQSAQSEYGGGTLQYLADIDTLSVQPDATKCIEITENSAFTNVKTDLANKENDWFNKIKYLSKYDMLKLGVEVTGKAYQESTSWLYVDNSFVGIQLFAGDSEKVGAPDLEKVPESMQFNNDTSVEEYARWFIKFQSDKEENLQFSDGYNGSFEGVTVGTSLHAGMAYPSNGAYGHGVIHNGDAGIVDENMLIMHDLDSVLKGKTMVSARFFAYLSDKTKRLSSTYVNYTPVNYRAQIISATPAGFRYDENGNKKIGLSVRFNEPIQFQRKADGSFLADEMPKLEGYYNKLANNVLSFNYVSGEGTDTIYFEADVSTSTANITSIHLTENSGFESIYDYAPNVSGQQLSVTLNDKGDVYGWENVHGVALPCSFDLRTPEISVGNTISKMVKTSHSVVIRTYNISETGMLYYGWTTDDTTVPASLDSKPISAQGFQTITSPMHMSGTRYLYVEAVSTSNIKSQPLWIGPLKFDNDKPVVSVECTSNTYEQKDFSITINNKTAGIENFDEYADLKKSMQVHVYSDPDGESLVKSFSIPIANEYINQEVVQFNFVLMAQALGLEEGGSVEYGTFYVSFAISDELENEGVSQAVAYYFDVRNVFGVEQYRYVDTDLSDGDQSDIPFEIDEFMQGGALHGALGDNYYTLDLTKMADATDPDILHPLYFRVKSEDDSIEMRVAEFINVAADENMILDIVDESAGGVGAIKFTKKIDTGLYRVVFMDATPSSTKKSLPIYLYVTDGLQEETGAYQTVSNHLPLTNQVFQLSTSIPYYYLTSTGAVRTQAYCSINKPLTFSSWWEAIFYVLHREYADLYAVTLTQAMASDLNSGIYRKSAGSTQTAKEGQVWIRYKDTNWRPNSTTASWVYYYYDETASSLPINLNAIGMELTEALMTIASFICGQGREVDLVTEEYLNDFGAPTLLPEQMRLQPESISESMCGTQFEDAVTYEGDAAMYIALDPDAPLATNVYLQSSENRRLFYKTEGSAYQILPNDTSKTIGELIGIGATGKYTILELDEAGARAYSIYVDQTAPELTVTWKTQSGADGNKKFEAVDSGQTISGSNFRIQSMDDYDALAFVAVYRYTGQMEGDLIDVYRKSDFDSGVSLVLGDGKFHVHVSDRSGNDYTFIMQVKSEPLVCSIREAANSYIEITVNRTESEVRYQVFLDDWLITTDYNDKRFTQGGTYRFLVEDIYGNVYDEEYVFERDLPTVTWRYKTVNGAYSVFKEDCEQMRLLKIDDNSYVISTSTNLQFSLMDGCTYEIISGAPQPNDSLTSNWVTLNAVAPFTMKVYYEKHPEIYVIYTCRVDNAAPNVQVSYQNVSYTFLEMQEIQGMFANGEFPVGETEFIPSSIGFTTTEDNVDCFVQNGETVKSKYFQVKVADESGVKQVQIYLNGTLITTKETGFNNILLNRSGTYKIVATDNFGNQSTFTFTNEWDNEVQYLIDGVSQNTEVAYADYFTSDKVYAKVEYGHKQVEVKVPAFAELHYMITDAQGKQYTYAFIVEDGQVYLLQYVITVANVEQENGETKKEIESVSKRSATSLAMGNVVTIKDLGVVIRLSSNTDGTLTFAVLSNDTNVKSFTVETRISMDEQEIPHYFKTQISNQPSSIIFVDKDDNEYTVSQGNVKASESFRISASLDATIKSVQVAYSTTGNYTDYQTINDYSVLFDEEGMYHVKVLNRYGIQTEYFVIISSQFAATAKVELTDGTVYDYSVDYTVNNDAFYANKSIQLTVYVSSVNVIEKSDDISVTKNQQGYVVIYVEKAGTHVIKVQDEFGNELEKTLTIQTQPLLDDENLLTNFNEKALRRDENYTNQKVFINQEIVESKGIVFISMTYNGETVIVYDMLSEQTTAFNSDIHVGANGDGEYQLVFRDRYGNKLEKSVHYCATPTLTITRTTVNGLGAEPYSLQQALEAGVWTNDSVRFIVSASEYRLTVDNLENVSSIEYTSKTKNEYSVYYIDEYGYEYAFKVYLLREEVSITPAEDMSITLISNTFVTKDGVSVQFSQGAKCTYVFNDENEVAYQAGDVLYKDGMYHFKVVDIAGNVSTYTIKKDSAVQYRLEGVGANEILVNGDVTNGSSVQFFAENGDSAYIKHVFHNNELIEYNDVRFTERGKWELIIEDNVGNQSYFRFYILYGKLDGFTYRTPYDYVITSVTWELQGSNAVATETIKESGTLLQATENGFYTVTMQSLVTGDEKTFTFTIDKTPPTVKLVGCNPNERTINDVTIDGYSIGDTIYVYKDGELVKRVRIDSGFTDAPVINEGGKYMIVVENEAGIKSELFFERRYVPNTAGSVLIIVLSLAAVSGLLVGLIWRNHSKTDE